MKNYFIYLLKKRIPILITLTVISLLFFVLTNNIKLYIRGYGAEAYPNQTILESYGVGVAILALVIPVIEFSFKMTKISASQVYSFPILKRKFYFARYFMGILEIVIPFTISYLLSVLIIICSPNLYHVGYFFVYLPLILVVGILIYSYFVFFYTQANNVVDAIVTLTLSIVGPILLMTSIHLFAYINETVGIFQPFVSIIYLTDLFQILLCGKVYNLSGSNTIILTESIIGLCFMIAALVLFIIFSQRFRGEDAGQKTTSWFSYRTLIPLTVVLLPSLSDGILGFVALVALGLSLASTYLGYALYLRKFSLNKKYWIICGTVWVAVIAMTFVFTSFVR